MKIVLIDSTIGSGALKGHAEHFANGFACAAEAAGAELTILTHRNGNRALGNGQRCLACLTHSMHDRISRDRYDGKLEAHRIGRESFAADLHAVDHALSDTDLFIFPTAVPRELSGLALWLTDTDSRSRIGAIFHWGGSSGYQAGSLDAALLRQTGRELARARLLASWFAATQSPLALALEEVLGQKVHVTPSLTFFGTVGGAFCNEARVRVGIMGGARREKGAGQLDKIAALVSRDERVELIIQCHGLDPSSWLVTELSGHSNVTLLHEWLDESAMLSICASLDLAILPYDRWFYGQAISGVFTLLAGVGVPCVVPSSTWMSDRIAAGETSGVVYCGNSPEDIALSVANAIACRDELRSACRIKAEAWRRKYSADSVVNRLMELSSENNSV